MASGLWVTMATVDIYVLHFKKKSLPGCVVLNGRLRKKYVRNLSKLVCVTWHCMNILFVQCNEVCGGFLITQFA